jgi:hypothetical protein
MDISVRRQCRKNTPSFVGLIDVNRIQRSGHSNRGWPHWPSPYDPTNNCLFDQIVQSWDTANKDTELSNFSVCTTWGIKDQHAFLLDVYHHKLDFLEQLHQATIVLVEHKASGTSLIQELRAENFSIIQAAPAIDGHKTMRLRSQRRERDRRPCCCMPLMSVRID